MFDLKAPLQMRTRLHIGVSLCVILLAYPVFLWIAPERCTLSCYRVIYQDVVSEVSGSCELRWCIEKESRSIHVFKVCV